MIDRREFLTRGAIAAAGLAWPWRADAAPAPQFVNDVHSKLNRTRVAGVVAPRSIEELQTTVQAAASRGEAIALAGGRHAMGGQQFATGRQLIDLSALDGVVAFDPEAGWIEVGAGIQWPALFEALRHLGGDRDDRWGIIQKQTGADRLSLGGALAANAHGRGLTLAPIVGDVESFVLIDSAGASRRCSRSENPEYFRAAIGGYGLFGAVATIRLRLARRRRLERVVELVDLEDLSGRFEERIASGFLYGDCQYETAIDSPTGLRRGVLSCYRPVDDGDSIPADQARLNKSDWRRLVGLAHTNPARAFEVYADYYLGTSGQLYWSDTHQLSEYLDDYHHELSATLGEFANGSEMISELYVPRRDLPRFMEDIRKDFRKHQVPLIYGTIRLIERDDVTALPWARESFACVIVNLHTAHDPPAMARTQEHFRRLIDIALSYGGSYFLTYHRWARRDQLLAAYPEFPAFLEHKDRLDPEGRFTSDWYEHQRALVAGT